VVKKAYCDFDRYKEFKRDLHETAFEMIEIPHVRLSGKNSADIRMVVDALDLCYTKEHIDTFVILSGDSDFSPLVSKLRENAKRVIGLGVKNSSSDLFINNCDAASANNVTIESRQDTEGEAALQLLLETFEALAEERGDETIWGSMIKDAIKRRHPGFNERFHGFRTFGALLEEAAKRGMIGVSRDQKSGNYAVTASQEPRNAPNEVLPFIAPDKSDPALDYDEDDPIPF
jgi:hypothetical protein